MRVDKQDARSGSSLMFIYTVDIHYPHDRGGLDQFIQTVSAFGDSCAFVVTGGDSIDSGEICFSKSPARVRSLYKSYAKKIESIDRPLYSVIGDHDLALALEPSDDEYHCGAFRSHFGQTYYSYDYGDVHFIVLDLYPKGCGGGGWDRAQLYQIDWFKEDISSCGKDRPIVIFSHQPIYDAENYSDFLEIIDGYNVLGVVSGHVHANRLESRNGVQYFITGTLSGRVTVFEGDRADNPPGYRIFVINDGKLDSFYTSLENPHHVNLLSPSWRSLNAGKIEIVAKVLDVSHEISHVYCRIGDRSFQDMAVDEGGGALWSTWRCVIDARNIEGGIIDLEIVPASECEAWPYRSKIVLEGEGASAKEGVVSFVICSGNGEYIISLNGHELGRLDNPQHEQLVQYDLKNKMLKKVNTLSVKANHNGEGSRDVADSVEIKDFRIDCNGKSYMDTTLLPGFGYRVGAWVHAKDVMNFYGVIDND